MCTPFFTHLVYLACNAGELEGYGVYIYSGIGPHPHDRSLNFLELRTVYVANSFAQAHVN